MVACCGAEPHRGPCSLRDLEQCPVADLDLDAQLTTQRLDVAAAKMFAGELARVHGLEIHRSGRDDSGARRGEHRERGWQR